MLALRVGRGRRGLHQLLLPSVEQAMRPERAGAIFALVVFVVLVLAYFIGQASRFLRGRTVPVEHVLGVALEAVGVLAVAGCVALWAQVHGGSWHPLRRLRVAPKVLTEAEIAALLAPGGIRQEHEGVWSGPAGESGDDTP